MNNIYRKIIYEIVELYTLFLKFIFLVFIFTSCSHYLCNLFDKYIKYMFFPKPTGGPYLTDGIQGRYSLIRQYKVYILTAFNRATGGVINQFKVLIVGQVFHKLNRVRGLGDMVVLGYPKNAPDIPIRTEGVYFV